MESRILFKSMSSGSCGNCYYLGLESPEGKHKGLIIDAGVSLRRLKRTLVENGISLSDISCLAITHDHLDHIRSLGSFCKKLDIDIWATAQLHKALSHHFITGQEYETASKKALQPGQWHSILDGEALIRYFEVPHDATQTVGFAIQLAGHNYVHITDCGALTEEALDLCRQAHTVVLESNYDTRMLIEGPYTEELKRRILNGNGHMSNSDCARAIKNFAHEGLKNLFLCHLSENNNTPQLAYLSAREALEEAGMSGVRLQALPRTHCSELIYL